MTIALRERSAREASVRRHLSRGRNVIAITATMLASALASLLVLAVNEGIGPLTRPEFAPITSLPLATYPVVALATVGIVLARNHWWVGLALFFTWMPLEDLVRKFTGNDLRVYFIKDLILVGAIVGVLSHLRGAWRKPLGEAWLPTLLVFVVAAVMSLPGALRNVNLPFIAVHTRFLFALLFPIGVFVARDRRRLENTMIAFSVLMAGVCVLGIAQAIVGPTFLNPSLETSPFDHLTVAKNAGAYVVLRPSGPFADVSRFASWTVISVVVALAAVRLASTSTRRTMSHALVAISIAASFASASRAAFLITVPITVFSAILFPAQGKRVRVRPVLGAALALVIAATIGGRTGQMVRATADFFAVTVNPLSDSFDLVERSVDYVAGVWHGLTQGAFVGRGTGTEALGARYLGPTAISTSGTESGWGSIAVEWGLLGLAVWVTWVYAWCRRARLIVTNASRDDAGYLGVISGYLVVYMTVLFSLTLGSFENYVANAFFWFLSGIVFSHAVTSGRGAATRPNLHVHVTRPLAHAV